MAWIKAQNGSLWDVDSMILPYEKGNSIFCGTTFLGSYNSKEVAMQVREDFRQWLDRYGHGVFDMPPGDYLVEQVRNCQTCNLIRRAGRTCQTCGTGHTNWKPRSVPDVKVFPAHDASKPIYGVVKNKPGEILEVVVDDETLTCKVLKVVRKGSHGIFTMELKE